MSDDDENAKTILGIGPPLAAPRAPGADEGDDDDAPTQLSVGEPAVEEGAPPAADARVPHGASRSGSGMRFDDFEWDLPEEFDPPSGLDSVMTMASRSNALSADANPEDSLPSTSALFGADYRGGPATGTHQVVAKKRQPNFGFDSDVRPPADGTRLFVGDDDMKRVRGLPPEVPEPGPAQSGGPPERTPPPDAQPRAASAGALQGESITAPTGSPIVLDVELEPVSESEVEAESVDASAASEPVSQPDAAAEPGRGGEATRSGSYSMRPSDTASTTVPSASVGSGRATADTPLVTPRLERATPIIASPVVAAREPTPDGVRALRRKASESGLKVRTAGRRRALVVWIVAALVVVVAAFVWFATR